MSFFDNGGLVAVAVLAFPPAWPFIAAAAVAVGITVGFSLWIHHLRYPTEVGEPSGEESGVQDRNPGPATIDPAKSDSPSNGPNQDPRPSGNPINPIPPFGSPNDRKESREIFRVVGQREEQAILHGGGRPAYGGGYDKGRAFWTSLSDAERYQDRTKGLPGYGTSIWGWKLPPGVGYPSEVMDGMPTWFVPYQQFPLVPPGRKYE